MKKSVWIAHQYVQIFIKRYYRLFIIGLIFGTAFFMLAPRVISKLPESKSVDRIGMVGLFSEQNLPRPIINHVSIGLTQIDEAGEPFPGLASTWKTNEDGKVWQFEIDPSISWSDGTPLRSSDLSFNFKDVKVTNISDTTVQFELPNPFSPFPHVVSQPVFRDNFVGVGPYQLSKVRREGQYLQMLEFIPISTNSKLPIKHYRFYPTEDAAKLGFKLGEIDQIVDLQDPGGFQDWNNVTISEQTQYQQMVTLLFKQQTVDGEEAELSEKSLRQGLAYALEDKSFGYERAFTSIPQTSWAYNPDVKKYEYNDVRAKELLGIDTEGAPELDITITTVSTLFETAQEIANAWKAIGVNVSIQVVNVVPQDFEVLLITQEVPQDPDQYMLWHSTQATNIIKFQNPKIDKLLEEGRKTLNQEERKQIYLDFQRFLNEDLPAIFLYHPKTYTIQRV